jgi:hypothetical protein
MHGPLRWAPLRLLRIRASGTGLVGLELARARHRRVRNKHRIHVADPHQRAVDALGGLNLVPEFSLVAVDGLLVRRRAWSRLGR